MTGVLALGAGVVLVGLAAWIPFRHRGEGRWPCALGVRVLVLPAGARRHLDLRLPVGMALIDIHSLEKPVGQPPNAAYKTVHFTASDGVKLEGWYRPSRNGASVLMISGGGSNRMGPLRHAKMLERHGYGVLVYDAARPRQQRGHAQLLRLGLGEGRRRGARLPRRGATTSIRAASARSASPPAPTWRSTSPPAATTSTPSSPTARPRSATTTSRSTPHKTLDRAPMWVLFKAMEVIRAGSAPKVSLADRIAAARAPHLLVSAGKQEKEWGELYDKAGGARSEVWYLPKAEPHRRAEAVPGGLRAARERVLRPPPGRGRLAQLQGRGLP